MIEARRQAGAGADGQVEFELMDRAAGGIGTQQRLLRDVRCHRQDGLDAGDAMQQLADRVEADRLFGHGAQRPAVFHHLAERPAAGPRIGRGVGRGVGQGDRGTGMGGTDRRRRGQPVGEPVGAAAHRQIVVGSCRALEQAVVEFPRLARRRFRRACVDREAQRHQQGRERPVGRTGQGGSVDRTRRKARDQGGASVILDQEIAARVRMLERRAAVGAPETGEAVERYPVRQGGRQRHLELLAARHQPQRRHVLEIGAGLEETPAGQAGEVVVERRRPGLADQREQMRLVDTLGQGEKGVAQADRPWRQRNVVVSLGAEGQAGFARGRERHAGGQAPAQHEGRKAHRKNGMGLRSPSARGRSRQPISTGTS